MQLARKVLLYLMFGIDCSDFILLYLNQYQKYDKGMLAATVDIVKTDGAGTLLSGLGPTVVGYGIEGAMKFGVYEVAKPIFANLMGSENKKVAFLGASILAGAVAALLLCPMESLRIKQVTDPGYADESLLTGLPKLIGAEGVMALFGGVAAMLAKQVSLFTYPLVDVSANTSGLLLLISNSLSENARLSFIRGASRC